MPTSTSLSWEPTPPPIPCTLEEMETYFAADPGTLGRSTEVALNET